MDNSGRSNNEYLTPENTRDHLHETSALWTVSRKEIAALELTHITHRLHRKWSLWYLGTENDGKPWTDRLSQVSRVKSIEQFWALFNYVFSCTQLPVSSGYYFFKDGIKPLWTDAKNAGGGQFVISLPRPNTHDNDINSKLEITKKLINYWTRATIAVAGEQFDELSEWICGVALNIEMDKYEISLWIGSGSDESTKLAIENSIRTLLKVSDDEQILYEEHPKKISPVIKMMGLRKDFFNCDRVFNLVSAYGSCLKVMFPSNDVCLIQMHVEDGTQSVIDNLNGWLILEKKLVLVPMRIKELHRPAVPFKLKDGSSSFKQFYEHYEVETKELIPDVCLNKPTNTLFFFDAPATMTSHRVRKIFENHSIKPKQISVQDKHQKSSSGLIVFNTPAEAMKGLLFCNHTSIVEAFEKDPYLMKLCFVSTS